jgi:GTP cyclohydrolase I
VRTDDPNAPRTIDLDVSYYADMVDPPQLPDPAVLDRAHVAIPIAEIVPDWVHPVTGVTAGDIAADLDRAGVYPLPGLAVSARRLASAGVDFDDVTDVYAPRMSALVRQQLIELGEDPDREGLLRTPLRVAKAMDFLTSGYTATLDEVVNDAIFDAEGAEEMVVVKDIEFYSMCEHHLLPFFGKCHVAYIPQGRVLGLSKIPRLVEIFSRRLQIQERLTNEVGETLREKVDPLGVAVVVEATHLCMSMRGVEKQNSFAVTSAMLGVFRDSARTRMEFLELIRRPQLGDRASLSPVAGLACVGD